MAKAPKAAQTDDKSNSRPTGETGVDHPIDPKPAPEATKEQLEGARSFLSREFPSVKFEAPNKAAATAKAEDSEDSNGADDELPPVAKKQAKPAAAAPKPKKQPSQPASPEPITADQIAEAAARGVAKGMSETKERAVAKEEKSAEESLSPSEKRKADVLRHLETLHPDKYSGLADKFIKSAAALTAYGAKWEEEHPGQEFDDQSPEHEDFFKKNDVDWDEEDFSDAAVDMRVQRSLEGKGSETKQEIDALKRKIQLQESGAEIGAKQTSAAEEYWKTLGEEFSDIIAPSGKVNNEKLTELQKADPEGTAIRLNAARALNTEVAEIHKVYNGLATFQPETNPVHRVIRDFGGEMESKMLSKPAEDRLDSSGRPFVSAAQYNRLSQAQQQQCWTFSADDLIAMRTNRLSKLVKQSVSAAEESHRRWAKARGIEVPGATQEQQKLDADETEVAPPPIRVEKPRSPSASPEDRGSAARGARPLGGRGVGVSGLL